MFVCNPFLTCNCIPHLLSFVCFFLLVKQDSGIKAFVSGLAVASSEVMIGSSLNDPETKTTAEAYRCQKPYSGYIKLITEWREDMLGKAPESVFRLFPFGD